MQQNTLTAITNKFNRDAVDFISEYCKLEKVETPDFSSLDDTKLLNIYSKYVNDINVKLLLSRRHPLTEEYLNSLNQITCLPKSTQIMLESIQKKK